MTAPPRFETLLQGEGRVLGTWTQFADPDLVDLLGAGGWRFTIIDCEHGAFGIETAAALVRACEAAGLVPLVRVPRGDHALAGKALDCGAAGIVAPGVECAAEAAAMAAALRFAPQGTRGACPIVRAAGHSLSPWAQLVERQAAPGLLALVESPAGVREADAIAAVDGVSGLMAGPFDLSVALGVPGDVLAPSLQQALEALLAAARGAGKPLWMPAFSAQREALQAQVAAWSARGVRHFAIGADKIMAAHAVRQFHDWAAGA